MKSSIIFGLVAALIASPVMGKTGTTVTSGSATATLSNLPSEDPHIGQITNQGCFNSSGDLELASENLPFNSDGKCGELCQSKEKAVGATTGSQECWCGDEYPPVSHLVDDSECNLPCTGFEGVACGGLDTWSVYNTGLKLAVHNSKEKVTPTTSSASPTQTNSASSSASSTSSDDSEEKGSNSKTIGIAVGVVVAVLIVGGAIGSVLWYLRRKRNQEIEEEHRRNAAVNAFINGSNPPSSSHGSISMTDSRLDPVMAHRRLSDGSIADNQDYSRKILRVTNA